jgi:alkylation response protein AidB-like acyl-CoA dehydrogenase
MAHISDFGLLLARTSDAPRHKGITCFLLDLATPGVEVRPIRQMTGEAEFNEVIFDGAYISDEARVGEVDRGWAVALGTLMAERVGVSQVIGNRAAVIDEILDLWRSLPPSDKTPARRDALTRLVVRSRMLDLMRSRVESTHRAGIPGPEGSMLKLMQAELTPDVFDFGLDLLGANGLLYGDYELPRPASWSEAGVMPGDVRRAFLRSRAYPIEGGACEIQRNTIAERVLGLPRG